MNEPDAPERSTARATETLDLAEAEVTRAVERLRRQYLSVTLEPDATEPGMYRCRIRCHDGVVATASAPTAALAVAAVVMSVPPESVERRRRVAGE